MEPNDAQLAELRGLLEEIYAVYGYDLRGYVLKSIWRRAKNAQALSGLESRCELRERVLNDPAWFATFLETVTIHVSEMFRDPSFFRVILERVVPILRTYPLLRVWHAGCATGEEVYAMAILFEEEGLYERTQFYGTDLSPRSIDRAKHAVYPGNAIRQFTANYQQAGGKDSFSRYYHAGYDRIALRDSLKRNVVFFQHDLISDHTLGEMHAIFCRNVLIYFDGPLQRLVLSKLSESLCHGGFLCLGNSEGVSSLEGTLTITPFSETDRIYRVHGRA